MSGEASQFDGFGEVIDLRINEMSKHFGSLVALDHASLHLPPGSFHALLGENGAGKSTLVKCVMGFHHPDTGSVSINGREHRIRSPLEAHGLGLGMVYQQFTLVPSMTVAENLLLAKAHFSQIINWRKERKEMEAFIESMPFSVDLDVETRSLAAGEKQKVEILKQLFLQCSVLILDEPTSVLTPDEADQILGHLKNMTDSGHLSVLLITHKLRELFAFAEDVTVLRGGRVTGQGKTKEHSPESLTELMIGAQIVASATSPQGRDVGTARLELENVSALNDRGHTAVAGVSFKVHAGEIVGIAGVSGNGQRELMEVLTGQRELAGGRIVVNGEVYRPVREQMRRHKVCCLPEEPLRNGAVGRMTVAENLAFRNFDVAPYVQGNWFINERAIRAKAKELVAEYDIRTTSVDAPVDFLSGGNVQRLVLARELSGEVDVLVVANPCFGLDVRAISEIRGKIAAARDSGAAVLLISEDLDEIFELSDRILVIFEGRIDFQAMASDADRYTVGHYMAGHRAQQPAGS